MKRMITLVLAALMLFSAALADEWICPSCEKVNTKKFCGSCGTKRPASECPSCGAALDSESSSFCAECGSSLTGAPADGGPVLVNGFGITSVKLLETGAAEITWTDEKAQGPYTFGYQLTDTGREEPILKQAETIEETSLSTMELVPGARYTLYIWDSQENCATYHFKPAAAAKFSVFPTSLEVTPKKQVTDGFRELKQFYKSDIVENLDKYNYGVYLLVVHPQMKEFRAYNYKLTITSPSGICHVFDHGEWNLSDFFLVRGSYAIFQPFDTYFENLIEHYDGVEVGEYTVTVYWDGMKVCSNTFDIGS